jgi:hypothetical protein
MALSFFSCWWVLLVVLTALLTVLLTALLTVLLTALLTALLTVLALVCAQYPTHRPPLFVRQPRSVSPPAPVQTRLVPRRSRL